MSSARYLTSSLHVNVQDAAFTLGGNVTDSTDGGSIDVVMDHGKFQKLPVAYFCLHRSLVCEPVMLPIL